MKCIRRLLNRISALEVDQKEKEEEKETKKRLTGPTPEPVVPFIAAAGAGFP